MRAGTRPEKGRGSTNWLPLRKEDTKYREGFRSARAPEKTQGSLGSKSTPGPKQPAAMATTTTTTTHLTAGLEDANLASKILSHQVAADAVHSRELAALQLKYATKTTELDAAHATREAHRPQQEEVLFTNDDSEIAGDLNSLKAQYNKLTRATAARAAHRTRVAEVRDAQTKEANGLKREQKALQKSLADVDATYDASVKTLETQLLAVIKVQARGGVEAGTRREKAPHRRGPIKTGLVKGGPVELNDRPRRVRTPARGPADAARGGGRGGRARRPRRGPGRARAAAES